MGEMTCSQMPDATSPKAKPARPATSEPRKQARRNTPMSGLSSEDHASRVASGSRISSIRARFLSRAERCADR